jgi:Domain of unknown function (DUF4351)
MPEGHDQILRELIAAFSADTGRGRSILRWYIAGEVRHLGEERRFLLFNFVATHIESDQRISEEYDELFRRKDNREVRREMMTWAEKIEAKGYDRGLEQGHRKGLEHGRREGEAALLLRMAERKFGQVSPEARGQIEKARPEQLLEWGERLVSARSLEETLDGSEPLRQ